MTRTVKILGLPSQLRHRGGDRKCCISCCSHNVDGRCAITGRYYRARQVTKPCARFVQATSTTSSTCAKCVDGCGCKIAGWPSLV